MSSIKIYNYYSTQMIARRRRNNFGGKFIIVFYMDFLLVRRCFQCDCEGFMQQNAVQNPNPACGGPIQLIEWNHNKKKTKKTHANPPPIVPRSKQQGGLLGGVHVIVLFSRGDTLIRLYWTPFTSWVKVEIMKKKDTILFDPIQNTNFLITYSWMKINVVIFSLK